MPETTTLQLCQRVAATLNWRTMGDEITKLEAATAASAGLVIVFGSSDDRMELRGAIHDEISCYGGRTVWVDHEGASTGARPSTAMIHAVWSDEDPPCWTYSTEIQHATFEINEEGEPYCRGIVFSLADLGPRQ